MLTKFRESAEYLAGERDDAPEALRSVPQWLTRAIVWMVWIVLIYVFCGQSSKFIYIDF